MIESALKSTFGWNCKIKETNVTGLPLYMKAGRKITEVDAEDCSFLLVFLPEDDRFGTIALQKQSSLYEEKSGLRVAYYFEKLTKVQRNALIDKKIPFISMPDQVYLPFLGVAICNKFPGTKRYSRSKMMPVTQSLFLYLLYNREDKYVLKKQAAEQLHLTRTSITRASEQLRDMGLLTELVCGKEIHMCPVAEGKEYYEMAREYLINPVQKRICIKANQKTEEMSVAGESALSRCSMLGEPKMRIFAIYKGIEYVKKWTQTDSKWQSDDEMCTVELWKYDPQLFAKNGMVDPVSLAMSLCDMEDERVEGELERYMEEYAW